jgi:hypothetical protein
MPRGARRDLAVTKLLRDNGMLSDSRSFVSHPDSEAKVHLYLKGLDLSFQRDRVFVRDKGRCRLRLKGCTGIAEELDHVKGGTCGRCDCKNNLRAACGNCHRKRHVHLMNPKLTGAFDTHKENLRVGE